MLDLRKSLGLALLAGVVVIVSASAAHADCAQPANAIEAENCLPGSPSSEWDVAGAGDPSIQGFATDISVNRGETIQFKVKTDASSYHLDIYRLGYYGGNGARKMAAVAPSATLPQAQPACLTDATGLTDCGNWAVSASWAVPADAISGVYIGRLVRDDTGGASHVVFVVRDDGGGSDLLFQTSDTTWQAYNRYGGASLYWGSGPGGGLSGVGRAYKVSYNRPFSTREYAPEDWVFNAEYPMVRWLERNGYDVSYFTGLDADRRGAEIALHRVFLSVGHDEYWSKQQRLNVERARDGGFPGQVAPVHLGFFSGNEVFWKTRWEPSIDGSGADHRTLVCYKETHEGAKIDPSPEWTGTWRDPRFSPPADGGQPENALSGTIFTVNGIQSDSLEVPAEDGQLRFWRNTPNVSALAAGQVWIAPNGTLGYEWDEDLDNGFRPPGVVRLSTAVVDVPGLLQDYGSIFGPGTATHHLVFHKRANGALVFGAGTVQWSWGLDADHDRGSAAPSVDMQQATVNLLADMGAQPATLQPGLVPASASVDVVPPVSDITSPADHVSVPTGSPVTIAGTASDGSPGLVGAVEISVDDGVTWHPANGRGTWSYVWTPAAAGTYAVLARAVDDSGNVESPGPGRTIFVEDVPPPSAAVSIWAGAGTPSTLNDYDGQELELGVKIRSSSTGYITAIRFYKASLDGSSHVVSLWGSGGTLLSSATSSGETASGWQEVALASPVAIAANTTYVASYHASPGYYVASTGYFTSAVTNGPLTALADGTDGPNGVYRYGASGFPTQSYQQTNYWVDVVFAADLGADTTAPTVISTSPANGAASVAASTVVMAQFSESLAASSLSTTTFELRDAAGQLVPSSVTWDGVLTSATLQPASWLSYSTTYTATVKGGAGGVTDVAGNPLAADVSWTFTTEGSDTGPPPGWYAGDVHVHRSCGGPPESVASLYAKMADNDLATISLLADMGNGEVQDPVEDLPRVIGADDPISTPGRIVHWDAEWHWDATYTQYPHQALGGHILALGLTDAEPVWEEYTYPVFEWARERGGIAGFAHMQYLDGGIPQSLDCCRPLEYPVEVALGSASFIEEDVLGSESAIQAYYRLLNTGFRPGLAAGTDYPCGVSTLGSLLTYVQVPNGQMTYQNWIEGIAAGRTVVSRDGQNEFLSLTVNGNATPGDEIRLSGEGGAVQVDIRWTARQSLSGTIELVQNGVVVAAKAASAAPGVPATLSTTVNFSKSGWLAARRMGGNGHQVHTAAVFVIVNDAPIRVSADDAQFFVQWIDNLLDKTAPGGAWSSFFPTSSDPARARYQAARDLFQQIAIQADTTPPSVTAVAPAGGASNVPVSTAVTAVFSEPLAPATVNGSTFELRDGGGALVASTVTWNGATNSIVLQPSSTLGAATAYTATVKGGAGGVTDIAGNPLAADVSWTFTTQAAPPSGSASIWAGAGTPSTLNDYDGQELELGVKFRSSAVGYITAIRFYKASLDGSSHIVSLWGSGGTLLASATSSGETASGWQEVALAPPVAIAANTTYVASYHTSPGYYVASTGYFTSAVTNGPLTALADGTDGPNGVYRYGASGFPTQSYQQTNYWVDVVFSADLGADTTAPTVLSTSPANGTAGVAVDSIVSAQFSEPLAPSTITGGTVFLRDSADVVVPATVAWEAATTSVTLRPTPALAYSTPYTATIIGGANGVTDPAGNPLVTDYTWSFTTQAAPPPPPDEGPGGPILVVSSSGNPFSRYYAEILRTEGLNAFKVEDISNLDPSSLAQYDIAILGEMALNSSQVTMLTDWVNSGGQLIAMRPDPKLATLLGLSPTGTTLSEGYLAVDATRTPGLGIVGETMQFHGTADRYSLAAAASPAVTLAQLYSNATTLTTNPALTLRSVGASGGKAAAFAFDLARSIVYSRQGNPAWAGDERDGVAPRRSDDLFYGNKDGDPQPDWVDLTKVAIPQADEQQRLLANLILEMTSDRTPLPRFWYFPHGEKAVVVMAVDNHGNETVETRFEAEEAESPAGCSVEDWECIRSTVYLYTSALPDDATAKLWEDNGFEIALHLNTDCADWTASSLASFWADQKADFVARFPSLAPLQTNRTHCIPWSDWATQPKVELANGIRLDANYYYWPPWWLNDTPGFFTGSGMPMRFADLDGSMIDVYQAVTQMTDESGQTYPFTIDTLLDKALGPQGFFGAFTANIHADGASEATAAAVVDSAKARGVPVVSAKQMLTWLDGRNGSSFESLTWSGGVLTFGIDVGEGAHGLEAMLPADHGAAGRLTSLERGGIAVSYDTQVIKGIEYVVFDAQPGTYQAKYTPDSTPPAISSVSVSVGTGGTASVQWLTDEPATSLVHYGTVPGSLPQEASAPLLLTAHTVFLNGLTANTTYYYDVTSADASGNSATSPVSSFLTPDSDTTPPRVVATTPSSGSVGVAIGTSVTASFSEALAPSTVNGTTVQLRGPSGQLVAANVTWDPATTSAILAPTAPLAYSVTYTATVKGGAGGVTDLAGNALVADVVWTFTTQAAPAGAVSLWGSEGSPSLTNLNDGVALEVGVKFRSTLAGYITAIRFYKGSQDTGTHVGSLWSSAGTLLAVAAFSGETASGWQEAPLASPVPIAANTTYVASYHSSSGYYVATLGYFTQPFTNGSLTALADGVDGGNGVYRYGASAFPNQSYQQSNYWADVVFTAQAPN